MRRRVHPADFARWEGRVEIVAPRRDESYESCMIERIQPPGRAVRPDSASQRNGNGALACAGGLPRFRPAVAGRGHRSAMSLPLWTKISSHLPEPNAEGIEELSRADRDLGVTVVPDPKRTSLALDQ